MCNLIRITVGESERVVNEIRRCWGYIVWTFYYYGICFIICLYLKYCLCFNFHTIINSTCRIFLFHWRVNRRWGLEDRRWLLLQNEIVSQSLGAQKSIPANDSQTFQLYSSGQLHISVRPVQTCNCPLKSVRVQIVFPACRELFPTKPFWYRIALHLMVKSL